MLEITCDHSTKSTFKFTLLIIFVVVYVIIGALVFSGLEGPNEKRDIQRLKTLRAAFLQKHNCVTDEELEAFMVEIVRANERGVSAIRNVTMEPNWSFGQSFFFAGTILTTIGYGHVAPLSDGGKGFCILYALIGIPLTLIMFTAIVERLNTLATIFLQFLIKKMQDIFKIFHIRLFHLSIMVLIVLIFVFLIPASIFTAIEVEWNFLDSFYYCFISMTTIGLGDYIPGEHPDQSGRTLYKISLTVYLFLGLVMMMLVITVLYEIPELNLGIHFQMKGDTESEAESIHLRSSQNGHTYTQHRNEPDISISESVSHSNSYQRPHSGSINSEDSYTHY